MTADRPLRVALDVRPCLGAGTGICTYIRELVRHLLPLGVEPVFWALADDTNLGLSDLDEGLRAALPQTPLYRPALPMGSPYRGGAWRRWARRPGWLPAPRLLPEDLDLYHATLWPLPLQRRVPWVITVQNLIGLRHPEWVSAEVLQLHQALAALTPQATRVMVSSEATRRDLLEFSSVDPARVSVVHLGVDERWFEPVPPEEIAAVRRRHGLRKPYVLALGTVEPRKNLGRLIEAFSRIAPVQEREVELVVAGPLYDLSTQVRETWGHPGVHLLSFISQPEVTALTAGAEALAFPSLYEGFGLPVLEAMAAGCPVVCSNATSLPEVAGDAALLFDPLSADEMADALRRVLTDKTLREELQTRGRQRAREFTWDRTAEQTLAVYTEAAGTRS